MAKEVWVLIPGWTHYEVSDMGRVRSLDRTVKGPWGAPRFKRGQILKQTIDANWYCVVNLTEKPRQRSAAVHHLVAETFIGPRPKGALVLHWDDDPENNQVSNLRYGTHSENSYDAVRNGHNHHALKTHCPHGHAYTPENTYVNPNTGSRACRTCRKLSQTRLNRTPMED